MSNSNGSFAISCNSCSISSLIQMNSKHKYPEYLYSGICPNEQCTNRLQFVCRPCYDYSSISSNSDIGRFGGRKIGLYSTIKNAKSHVVKNRVRHNNAMKWFNDKNKKDDNESSIDIIDDINTDDILLNNNHTANISGLKNNSISLTYHEYESQYPGKGAKYLIGNAFELSQNDHDNISDEEVLFFLKLSLLLSQLTQQQQKTLAELFLNVANCKELEKNIFKKTRVPTTMNDFEHIFLSKKKAIIPNLPHPVVKVTNDKTHAYVSLVDVLANELASGNSFDEFSFTSNIIFNNKENNTTITNDNEEEMITVSKSEAARQLYFELHESRNDNDPYIMYLWLKEWRDAFDPNNTKSSRNQVWINTFTICPTIGEKSGKNTYFMSISGKADSHNDVDQLFGDEIKQLSTDGCYFYHGGMKRIIKVKLGRLITCVDRPERASMFQFGDHAGSYSGYWGHAGSVDGSLIENHLPSCDTCRFKLLEQYKTNDYSQTNTCSSMSNCCAWNVKNNILPFKTPDNYPTICDRSLDAPNAPRGREIADEPCQEIRLAMINANIEWLKEAIVFAYHNMRTLIPNIPAKNKSKPYWTKGNGTAYLRSCGVTGELITSVLASSSSNDDNEPCYPATWLDTKALNKCHYAGMHMLYLGHMKSNYDMLCLWLSKHSIITAYGKQANIFLDYIKKLRVHQYYSPHNLSVTKWGTGNWVSENYVFIARTQKFFFILPSISKCKLTTSNKTNKQFMDEYRAILRFVSACHAAFSRIMSTNKHVDDMQIMINIYMDTMVEMDTKILSHKKPVSNFSDTNLEEDTITNTDPSSAVAQINVHNTNKKQKIIKQKKNPNFVKSNSLGIMSVAEAHKNFGPLILNWEGGYEGERKIQEVKPLLTIKRENAEWQRITLQRLYQQETISKILESTLSRVASKHVDSSIMKQNSRQTEGLLKIFNNKTTAIQSVNDCLPLSAVIDKEHRVWIGYRPADGISTRSSLILLELIFDDTVGEDVQGLCWMAPITVSEETLDMKSMLDVMEFAKEYALLLPYMSDTGDKYINKYYAIGSKWSERNKNGRFEMSQLNTTDIFVDWNPINMSMVI